MYIDNLIKEATLEKNSAKKEAYRAIKAELLLNRANPYLIKKHGIKNHHKQKKNN